MKVAIVGSRSFTNVEVFEAKLKEIIKLHNISPINCIISGGALGIDSLAQQYAIKNNIPTQIFLPDWTKYKKKAGYVRNIDIVSNADIVVAFWDGISKGTKHTIRIAKTNNKKLVIVEL